MTKTNDAASLFGDGGATYVVPDVFLPVIGISNQKGQPPHATAVDFELYGDDGHWLFGHLWAQQTPDEVLRIIHSAPRGLVITGVWHDDRHPRTGYCWIKGRIDIA